MDTPKICATLTGTTVEEMLADASLATVAGADMVEARLDMLYMEETPVPSDSNSDDQNSRFRNQDTKLTPRTDPDINIDEALSLLEAGIELPVVLTCRPKRQGGYFPGTEDERCAILRKAIESGVSWVDLETDIEPVARSDLIKLAGKKTSIIASVHYDRAPDDPDEVIQKIRDMASYGDLVKACYATSGKRSALKLFEAAWELKGEDFDYTIMGLGEAGDWTRIHAPAVGISMVYTTSEVGPKLTSSGRINTVELTGAWEMLGYS